MTATVKEMVAAAHAVVPKVTPDEVKALAGKTRLDLGFADVRNAGKFTDLAAGGVKTE